MTHTEMKMPRNEVKRVLIVDDDDGVRTALNFTLKSGGYKVEQASSGQEGLAKLKEFRPHMVISDYLMPGMNGLEFLCLVRTRCPDTIRILVTGHAETHVAIEAINQGEIFRFITKPWDVTEILTVFHIGFQQLAANAKQRRLETYVRRLSALWGQDLDSPPNTDVRSDGIGGVVDKLLSLENEPEFYDAIPVNQTVN